MRSLVKTTFNKDPIAVKESYDTIKRRIMSLGEFIEVTDQASKLFVSKSVIELVCPLEKEVMVKQGEGKKEPKVTTKVNKKGGKETVIS